MIATILPALLAAATLSAADSAALDAQVAEIFRPYGQGVDSTPPWERPIFSAEVNALIAHWQRVLPEDEPDRLNDGDWLCQCQDFNEEAFKVTASGKPKIARTKGSGELVSIDVKIDLGFGPDGIRDARLLFKREGGAWKVDDLYARDSFPEGLKQALRETIAEDEALRAKKGK